MGSRLFDYELVEVSTAVRHRHEESSRLQTILTLEFRKRKKKHLVEKKKSFVYCYLSFRMI